jgi:chemotaxis protein MotB
MPVSPRRQQRAINIWPGFVDALATLLIVIIFVLLVFVLAQFFLSEALTGRDAALRQVRQQLAELTEVLALERKEKGDLTDSLARLQSELQATLAERTALAEAIGVLRAEADQAAAALGDERKLSEGARADVVLLNQQLAALRTQLEQLQKALAVSEQTAAEQQVQITALGQRLNAALAGKVQELARYRSEFFGRMREILGDTSDIRIVGDRFVFSSEVLFATGSAEIGADGRAQLVRVAQALKDVSARIPADIDWILQVEGHTDRLPISTPQFRSNWELSTARAMSVIRLLTENGIPPQRLSAAGYGEFHPLEGGLGREALQRNRRIELKLTQR